LSSIRDRRRLDLIAPYLEQCLAQHLTALTVLYVGSVRGQASPLAPLELAPKIGLTGEPFAYLLDLTIDLLQHQVFVDHNHRIAAGDRNDDEVSDDLVKRLGGNELKLWCSPGNPELLSQDERLLDPL
jgi:hypothetical protein